MPEWVLDGAASIFLVGYRVRRWLMAICWFFQRFNYIPDKMLKSLTFQCPACGNTLTHHEVFVHRKNNGRGFTRCGYCQKEYFWSEVK